MFKATCLDAANKPNDIPTSQWVVKNREYTVIELVKCRVQNGLLGFRLAEINLDGCFPYSFYSASRFGITQEELERMIKEKKITVVEEKEQKQEKKEEILEEQFV